MLGGAKNAPPPSTNRVKCPVLSSFHRQLTGIQNVQLIKKKQTGKLLKDIINIMEILKHNCASGNNKMLLKIMNKGFCSLTI